MSEEEWKRLSYCTQD